MINRKQKRDKLFCSFLGCCLFTATACCQPQKLHYTGIVQAGIIAGINHVGGEAQVINGIRNSKWMAGAGLALDTYRYKTLPLFFDASRYFGNENQAFLFADMGYHFPLKNKPGNEVLYYDTYSFHGGWYSDAGIGLEFKLSAHNSFLISLGYSVKRMSVETVIKGCGFGGPCLPQFEQYKWQLQRIGIKVGFAFI